MSKLREYRVHYETRQQGAIGAFAVTTVFKVATSAQEAVSRVGASLRARGLETGMPVKVHRKGLTSEDFLAVPYTPWREAGDDNPAGLREDLLDDEEQARATTSRLELSLLADPQVRVKKGGES